MSRRTEPCGNCGAHVAAYWDYCTKCGYPMGEDKTPPNGTPSAELVFCATCACHYIDKCRSGHATTVVGK